MIQHLLRNESFVSVVLYFFHLVVPLLEQLEIDYVQNQFPLLLNASFPFLFDPPSRSLFLKMSPPRGGPPCSAALSPPNDNSLLGMTQLFSLWRKLPHRVMSPCQFFSLSQGPPDLLRLSTLLRLWIPFFPFVDGRSLPCSVTRFPLYVSCPNPRHESFLLAEDTQSRPEDFSPQCLLSIPLLPDFNELSPKKFVCPLS